MKKKPISIAVAILAIAMILGGIFFLQPTTITFSCWKNFVPDNNSSPLCDFSQQRGGSLRHLGSIEVSCKGYAQLAFNLAQGNKPAKSQEIEVNFAFIDQYGHQQRVTLPLEIQPLAGLFWNGGPDEILTFVVKRSSSLRITLDSASDSASTHAAASIDSSFCK